MQQSKKQPLSRKQTSDIETFDQTTPNLKVQANLVDMYVQPAPPIHHGVDPDVAAFHHAMTGIEEGLKGGAKIKRQVDEDRKKRGMTDAAAKKDPQETSDFYIMGHEILSGRAAANDLEGAMDQYFEENKDADPASFKQGMDRVSRQFLAGRSEYFVEGLMGEAVSIEQKYGAKYMAHVKQKTKEMGSETISSAFDYEMRQVLDSPVNANDADFRAKVLREMITGAQETGAAYGLSRTEVSERLVQIIGRQGMKLADPDLITKVANVPDKDGIRLIDNPELAPRIQKLHEAARVERDKLDHELEKRVRQAQQDVENTVANKILALTLDFDSDTKEAHELLLKYSDPSQNEEGVVLNPGFVATAHKLIANRGRGFAVESNPRVYAQALEKAGRGELSVDDALAIKGSLAEDEWKQVLGLSLREREQRAEGGGSRMRREFDKDLSAALKQAGQIDPFTGRYLDRNGPKRQAWLSNRARKWFADFEAREKREPNFDETFEKLQSLQQESFTAVKEEPEEGVSEGELAANKPVDPKAKPTAPPTQPSGKRQTTDPDVRQRLEKMKQRNQRQS
jgi:hypothetical protein